MPAGGTTQGSGSSKRTMPRRVLISLLVVLLLVSVGLFYRDRTGEPGEVTCRVTERGPDGSVRGVCSDGTEYEGAP